MNVSQIRQRWATALVHRGRQRGALPRYGSPAWCSLAENDPRRIAAVVVAAECWWQETDPAHIAERLADELAVARQIEKARDEAAFATVAAKVRALADMPTWEKVRERWGVSA